MVKTKSEFVPKRDSICEFWGRRGAGREMLVGNAQKSGIFINSLFQCFPTFLGSRIWKIFPLFVTLRTVVSQSVQKETSPFCPGRQPSFLYWVCFEGLIFLYTGRVKIWCFSFGTYSTALKEAKGEKPRPCGWKANHWVKKELLRGGGEREISNAKIN